MRMVKLVALKPHKYGTRHLTAGEEYEAPQREAIAMIANRRAEFAKRNARAASAAPAAPPAPQIVEPEPVPAAPASLDDLRMQATQLGINVDGRWGAHRLQHEIEQAKAR